MRPVIAFDLNGTLLDLSALNPYFERTFGDTEARCEWFVELLQSAMVATLTGAFMDFSILQKNALDMLAGRRDVALGSEEKIELLQNLRLLPPFPDVQPALERLRAADFRLAVLTNSRPQAADDALHRAGLRDFFDRVLSAEMVERYKPSPEVYRLAARELDVEPANMLMVTAHSWDIAGAIRSGCEAAFVHRPGQVLDPLAPKPRILVRDLGQFAGRIIEVERVA